MSRIPYLRLALLALAVLLLSATSLTHGIASQGLLVCAAIATAAVAFIRDAKARLSIFPRQITAITTELGVCTVGNVYTRRDRRRRGLAARVTSGVVQHAIAEAVPTIVLNVSRDNDAARRVYERLGFHCHCEFFEGEARRGNAQTVRARPSH